MHDPQVPETLEGWSLLHQMFRVRWDDWQRLAHDERTVIAADAAQVLAGMNGGDQGATAPVALLGHKGDLMLLHVRRDFEALAAAQLAIAQWRLTPYLEATSSFVSMVELGMYEMTAVIHARLREQGLAVESAEYQSAFSAEMEEQRQRVYGRLFPTLPACRHVCFYPMNKRRGEARNWFHLPVEERGRLMRDHGRIGRHYAGQVTQVISGSIGFDDWEWGVDLFADDPLVFKKLIYEMRFDEASALYAEFGPFYVGLRFSPEQLPRLLAGVVPDFVVERT